ncbi:hypothetical protein CWR48_08495 [Oceanobacillus arenosus]|uniref:ABC transporter periplasmic binding protein yphF n=1 Tax=Oceanobacillus arenosus TaxID=1229153 RepID=A0A3D8PVA6_9BACI|nr:hypothetical protein [Oceanobacillus arenosus]RDW19079.1 hypothetical protein CWR48_08495 [Oceanobacillus arenosus]
MRFTSIQVFACLVLTVFLSGCLYPDSEKKENQTPYEDQLEMVQLAVEQYKQDTNGLVPMKTKENETPIFEKYIIDFSLLKERNLLSEIPSNAYENGGVYQYVLITPEDDPRVKLIDLRITEALRSINVQLDIYRNEHQYPPYGEKVADNVFSIDFEALGLESSPTISSPYSQENLPVLMDASGKLLVDYRIDLSQALREYQHEYLEGDDIRYLLADHTPFVPAYSIPYTVVNDEPVFLVE